jgi:hypothetical protein
MYDTKLDRERTEELFQASWFYTDPTSKWCPTNEGKWERLKADELKLAERRARELLFSQRNRSRGAATEETWTRRELIVIPGNEVKREHLRFMWEPYLPLGKLIHFGGNSSQGKSPVTIDLAARITSGLGWPDDQPNAHGPRSVILLNVEDDLNDTIMPRFDLAGGTGETFLYVKGTKLSNENTSIERALALDSDIELIANHARSVPDLGLIVIDPITNYLGRIKMNDETEVRSVLTPIANLAAELNIPVITVGHFNRRERGTDPLHRMMGAAAFAGVARVVYAFGPDPEDVNKYAHVMTVVRGATGEGASLRYLTEEVERAWDGQSSKVLRVAWRGKSNAVAEDAVDPESSKSRSKVAEAAAILKEYLRDGEKSATECTEHLKKAGFDLEKLNSRRIRYRAKVGTRQKQKQWWWYLETTGALF